MKTTIKINSNSLGDTLCAIPAIDEYQKKTNDIVAVECNPQYECLFSSYTNLIFNPKEFQSDTNRKIHYYFNKNVQQGFYEDLGLEFKQTRPTITLNNSSPPFKFDYSTFSIHSTCQAKYWNNPTGWYDVCKYLRIKKITPVCLDVYESFGTKDNMNSVPKNCHKQLGMKIDEIARYIKHSKFYIGNSSGLSWLAWALGVKVIMISGVTKPWNEFSDNIIRINEESVCNGCFHTQKFDVSDWMWCPFHKNTNRQFECSKTITSTKVIDAINLAL